MAARQSVWYAAGNVDRIIWTGFRAAEREVRSMVHINLRESCGNWKSAVSLRTGKKVRIVSGAYAAVYVGLAIAAGIFNGWSLITMLWILAAGLVGVGVYATDAPVHRVLRFLVGLAIPVAAFFLLESYTHELTSFEGNAIRLNLMMYYLIYALVFFATGRLWLTCTIVTAVLMACGIANYFVLMFRSSPIVPWDFLSLGTAMSVAGNQAFSFDNKFAIVSAWFLTVILISLRIGIRVKLPGLRAIAAAGTAAVGGFLIGYLLNPETPDREGLDDGLWVAKNTYKKDGFLLAFTMNLRYLNISAPDGYDRQLVEELLATQDGNNGNTGTAGTTGTTGSETETTDDMPNVIVIMDETFSDPAVLGNFDTNQDYMPFIHSLQDGAEDTISGYVYVSVLGGNTANSEFEFLTGNSMKFFPIGSVPYQQYIHSNLNSMVADMNDLGYTTIAMHPYRAAGWNRNKVYPLMQFDQMLFQNDITYRTKLRNYVSDNSDFMNLTNLINKTDGPVFIHNVTMQNHSAYGGTYDNFTPLIEAEMKNTRSNKYLNNYLSLMYETDKAVESLIEKLKATDEKTIICFFGDHQPNDYVIKPVYKENGLDIENQTLEQQQKRQMTPFFIWANFDIEEEQDVRISSNYLGNLLLKAAGLPLDEYRTWLENARKTIPIMNTVGWFDTDGTCRSYDEMAAEQQEVLDTYEEVQYYEMFDQKKK